MSLSQAKSSSGIGELNSGKVRIYPNPSQGIFTIIPVEGNKISLNIEVSDMNGKSILKRQLTGQNEYQIDLSEAASGTYTVVMRSDTFLTTTKVVIIR